MRWQPYGLTNGSRFYVSFLHSFLQDFSSGMDLPKKIEKQVVAVMPDDDA
jgi:hypothetical protein